MNDHTSNSPARRQESAQLGQHAVEGLQFRGRVLAFVSSRHPNHRAHAGKFAAPRESCSACRWTEVTIFRRDDGDDYDYVVERIGVSLVPGELDRVTVATTTSAYELVELLTVRPQGGRAFMPPQHARALARAASVDDDIRDAYVDRAVV